MALIENWLPPSRQNYEWIVFLFQLFPLVTVLQYNKWIMKNVYVLGKTSGSSRFNLPGKFAWMTMEMPGFIVLLYCMHTIPTGGITSLPVENKTMGSLFVIHYLYRAIIAPLIAPSMSPISPQVWLFALAFQLANGVSIGSYLGGYGPTTRVEWQNSGTNYIAGARMELGLMIWAIGLIGNIYHDDVLREIRRAALRNQKKRAEAADPSTGKNKPGAEKKGIEKVYMIPEEGLFRWIFYPHYLCEWFEWAGFWIMGGSRCVPARTFLVNEIATMLPSALSGKRWYEEKFGKEKIAGRKAIIPGVL